MAQNRKRRTEHDEIEEDSHSKMACPVDWPIENEVLEDSLNSNWDLSGDRDFINEMPQQAAEIDENMAQNAAGKGMFEQIMDELKSIRVEMREIDAKNEIKFEELKEEIDEKIEAMSEEILRKIDEKLSEIPKSRKFNNRKMDKISLELISKDPGNIRLAFLGEWKMVEHENFEGYKRAHPNLSMAHLSQSVKYSMENGLLKQTGGGYKDMKEGENTFGDKDLFVEDNHLKTVIMNGVFRDRYIDEGRLHVVHHENGEVWKCIYEKI